MFLLVAGCETAGTAATSSEAVETSTDAADFEYVLGTGDRLRVLVFGEENLSGEFLINPTGNISLPLVGEIRAAGKTEREFQASIEAALREGYLNDPRVSTEVLNYRPYYILGEVSGSGEYPYAGGLTVMNAIATAGGYTYRANRNIVYIKRMDGDAEVRVELTPSTKVRPGDTIRVPQRLF
ncbi:MAG: polysaccharide biosynthesis protein [Ponticaulis sp.]|nr:polysaccharide biosynthesis protein [Ponticaulis sp.]